MQHKNHILLGLLLGVTLIAFVITYRYMRHQEHLSQRYHLLCEVLKPGMSIDEVLGTLRQEGDFTMRRSEWAGGDVELGINFTDRTVQDLYGYFELRFNNDRYLQAYISGFESYDFICDFSQLVRPVTKTPVP